MPVPPPSVDGSSVDENRAVEEIARGAGGVVREMGMDRRIAVSAGKRQSATSVPSVAFSG
jgi:hypothetical protein